MTDPPSQQVTSKNLVEEAPKVSTGQPFPIQLLVLMFLITGLFSTANFIGNVFTGLYAVIIGASASALSLITSLRNLIQLAGQSSLGRVSDKMGRKLLIFLGLLSSGVFLALFPLIRNGWILVAGVVVFSIGVAAYTPSFTALQGDISNKSNRAGLIALITIVGALASMVGLLAVGFASNLGDSEWKQYTIILEIAAGIFIIGAIISLFLVNPPTEKLVQKQVFTLAPVIKNKNFRRFVIVNSIMSFSMSLGWPIFPFIRGEYATAQQNTWIWSIFALFQIIAIIITRPFINKISRKKLLILGRLIMFYVPLNLALTVLVLPYWWHLALCNATSGLSVALFWVGQNSYILDCAPETEKGTYTGVHNLFLGITTFVGSLIMGIIADILIARYDKWTSIVILLFVITGARLAAALGFFFIKEPSSSQITKSAVTLEPSPEVTPGSTK